MKTTGIILALWLAVTGPLNTQAAPGEIERARMYGAKGRVTLRVIDSRGVPVANAFASARFYNPHQPNDVAEGQTDINGLFVASGTPVEDMGYAITKDGYYKTEGTYVFYRPTGEPLVAGRWQPWNPTTTVTLKEVRQPAAMFAKPVNSTIPQTNSPVGYDLEAGDWVPPHGQGKVSDLLVTYQSTVQDKWTYTKQLTIACSHKMDGFCRMPKDMWSALRSAYEAPDSGYLPSVNLIYEATKHEILKAEELGESEYLIIRVRTVLDDKGSVASAHYGKIYGPIQYGEGGDPHLRFTYYLNPTANDRNLEFDSGRNYLPWTYTDRTRVSVP